MDEQREVDYTGLSPRQKKEIFQRRLRALTAQADTRLQRTQRPYKRDFDRRVRKPSHEICVGERVFVKRETSTEQKDRGERDRPISVGVHKLLSKALGPYY